MLEDQVFTEMKFVTMVVIVVFIAYAALFRHFPQFREAVRTAQLNGAAEERFRIYAIGKAFARAHTPGSEGADFGAWGDDRTESSIHVNSDTDLAFGNIWVMEGGFKVRKPWCTAINRNRSEPIDFAVGKEVEETTRAIQAGTFQTALKKSGPARAQIGSWQSLGSALDKR